MVWGEMGREPWHRFRNVSQLPYGWHDFLRKAAYCDQHLVMWDQATWIKRAQQVITLDHFLDRPDLGNAFFRVAIDGHAFFCHGIVETSPDGMMSQAFCDLGLDISLVVARIDKE
jgi:hypothetical protein